MARLAALVMVIAATCAVARTSSAQPVDNDYAVDLYQGVVLAPTRITSLGGAYAGFAEGTEGIVKNAASPAVRSPYSLTWFDQDIDASLSIPLDVFANNDFDNSGDADADYTNFIYLTATGQMQVGPFGTGFFGDLQRYSLSFPPDESETFVTVGRYHVLLAWRFLGNQLMVGAGARALTLSITPPDTELTVWGASPQIGFLIRPDWMPFRFGATYRHAVEARTSVGSGETRDEQGIRRAGNLVLPKRVELPWQLEMGLALQVGARPINPEWVDPEEHEAELRAHFVKRAKAREQKLQRQLLIFPPGPAREALRAKLEAEKEAEDAREERAFEMRRGRLREERRARGQNWPREALLVTADLLVTGPVADAIHLERFLSQGQQNPSGACRAIASGEGVDLSPRFGFEVEPWPRWVHTRFGSYFEPQRFTYATPECDDRPGRQHFTFGADVKLLTTTWFGLVPEVTYKLQAYGDLAPRYQSFGLGFGVWH